MRKIRTRELAVIAAALFILAGTLQPADGAEHRKAPQKKSVGSFTIQGYRIGMTMNQVKRVLRARKIKQYETGFSDLFSYSPAPDSELRLTFSCSAKGYVVSGVELSVSFDAADAAKAAQRYQKQLSERYGKPGTTASQAEELNSCWGNCAGASNETRLDASFADAPGGKRSFLLRLHKDALARTCAILQRKKIKRWLPQWLAFVQKFKTGMTLKAAGKAYAAWTKERPRIEAVPDTQDEGAPVTNYEISGHEYFSSLNADSRVFGSEGPGRTELKFTGDQTGARKLDRRLYFCRFSTTKFSAVTLTDLDKKLDRFIRVFGEPTEVTAREDVLSALWEQGPIVRKLDMSVSGLITLEQSNFSIRDAYRNAVAGIAEKNKKKKFDKLIF